jgi:hypothetical protein
VFSSSRYRPLRRRPSWRSLGARAQADWAVTRKDNGYHVVGWITFGLGLIEAVLVVAISVQAVRRRSYRWLAVAAVVVVTLWVVFIAWREPALASICACDGA